MKLNQWLDIWLNKYARLTLKDTTFCLYERLIKTHISDSIGEMELNDITYTLIQDYVSDKLTNNVKILSLNTVRIIVSILKTSLKEAIQRDICHTDFMRFIKMPKAKEKEINALKRDEQEILENYCINKKGNHLGIVICLYTGIRIGELLALTWEDVDFESKTLKINKTMNKVKVNNAFCTAITAPKTDSSVRNIPLSYNLIKVFRLLEKKNKNYKYIIASRSGNIMDKRSYQRTFKRTLKKCNVKSRNFHALRHTFTTRALENGIDIKTISDILGHKTPLITLARYSHSLENHQREMMNKMSRELQINRR